MNMLIQYLGTIPAGAVLGWIVAIILALVCIYTWAQRYRKARNRYDDTQEQTATNAQQIVQMQEQLHSVEKDVSQKFIALTQHDVEFDEKLDKIQQSVDNLHSYQKKRDVNDLKDRIEKSYRFYVQRAHTAGSKEVFITETEREVFNGILESYSDAGGNSFVGHEIKPAFLSWEVIDDEDLPERLIKDAATGKDKD